MVECAKSQRSEARGQPRVYALVAPSPADIEWKGGKSVIASGVPAIRLMSHRPSTVMHTGSPLVRDSLGHQVPGFDVSSHQSSQLFRLYHPLPPLASSVCFDFRAPQALSQALRRPAPTSATGPVPSSDTRLPCSVSFCKLLRFPSCLGSLAGSSAASASSCTNIIVRLTTSQPIVI